MTLDCLSSPSYKKVTISYPCRSSEMSTNSTESIGIHSPLTLTQETISKSSVILYIICSEDGGFCLATGGSDKAALERVGAVHNTSDAHNILQLVDCNTQADRSTLEAGDNAPNYN